MHTATSFLFNPSGVSVRCVIPLMKLHHSHTEQRKSKVKEEKKRLLFVSLFFEKAQESINQILYLMKSNSVRVCTAVFVPLPACLCATACVWTAGSGNQNPFTWRCFLGCLLREDSFSNKRTLLVKTSRRIRAAEVGQSHANAAALTSRGRRFPPPDCRQLIASDGASGGSAEWHPAHFPLHSSFQSDPDLPLHLPLPLSHSRPPS